MAQLEKIGNLVAVTGQYLDADGQEKNRYTKCGTMFKRKDNDTLCLKLDAVPVGQEWTGWLNCYVDKQNSGGSGNEPQTHYNSDSGMQEDEIPF